MNDARRPRLTDETAEPTCGLRSRCLAMWAFIVALMFAGSLGCSKLSDQRADALLERTGAKLTYQDNAYPTRETLYQIEFTHGPKKLSRTDIDSLASFPKLESLIIKDCKLDGGINRLPDTILQIKLVGTGIEDLSFLRHSTRVEELVLIEKKITDYSPIAELTNLRFLHLVETQNADLDFLKESHRLETLIGKSLHQLSDLSALHSMSDLKSVSFWYCSQLKQVDLSSNAGLTHVTICNCRLTSIDFPNDSSVFFINLDGTSIKNLDSIADQLMLQSLYLSNTNPSDLEFAKQLTNLSNLSIANTPLDDLSPVSHITNWGQLDLSGSKVSDLSPLAHALEIHHLAISGTSISDLSPLTNTKIYNLSCRSNRFDQDEMREFLVAHPETQIYETDTRTRHSAAEFGITPPDNPNPFLNSR